MCIFIYKSYNSMNNTGLATTGYKSLFLPIILNANQNTLDIKKYKSDQSETAV